MNSPQSARRGVLSGVLAMTLAVIGTALDPHVINWGWIVGALVLGFVVGVPLSQVPLTAVPQRTALSHAFGGLAAGLLGTAKFYDWLHSDPAMLTPFTMTAIVAEVILGFLTFTGSLMAAGKLQEIKWIPQRPVTYKFQNESNLALLSLAVVCGLWLIGFSSNPAYHVAAEVIFGLVILLALAFGVLLIIPIGGADMPTVISLLNSYAGLSAVALGFVLDN